MKRFPERYRICLMLVLSVSLFLLKVQAQQLPRLLYNNDGSVTFVLDKPESRRVQVFCDCALRNDRYNIKRENLQSARMKLDSNGLFTFTTQPLAPEIYTYLFKTKGKRFVDPTNVDSVRVLNTKRSVFVIPPVFRNGVSQIELRGFDPPLPVAALPHRRSRCGA